MPPTDPIPRTTGTTRTRALVVLGLVASGLLAGCGASAPGAAVTPTATVLPAGAHVVHPVGSTGSGSSCGDPTQSIPPPAVLPQPGAMPAGTWMATIRARGYLLAGVDQNTYLWGYRDPASGQYTGFDIAMLDQVNRAIFGSPAPPVHYVVVPTADRQRAVATGEVDIVAETMTITCDREQAGKGDPYPVDFSTVYYQAAQRILVPVNSTIAGPADLAGKRVCATDGSTSLVHLANLGLAPPPVLWAVPSDTDCLVMMQQGQVDAISTDDVILQGLQAQDPNSRIVSGPALSSEPYGMAISKGHTEFTSFVNGVLAAERADGTWLAIYDQWVRPHTSDPVTAPPVASYRSGP